MRNFDEASSWWDNVKQSGAKVHAVDFTEYYTEHYCTDDIPNAITFSKKYIRNAPIDAITSFSNADNLSDTDRFGKLHLNCLEEWQRKALYFKKELS